jgi:hypothetical protein
MNNVECLINSPLTPPPSRSRFRPATTVANKVCRGFWNRDEEVATVCTFTKFRMVNFPIIVEQHTVSFRTSACLMKKSGFAIPQVRAPDAQISHAQGIKKWVRARCSVSTFDLLRSVSDKVRSSQLPFVFRVPFFPSEAFFDASEVDRVFSSCHPYSARAYLIIEFPARRFERGKPRTTTLWTVHPPWNFFPSIFGNMERSFGLFSTLKYKKSSTHNKDMC